MADASSHPFHRMGYEQPLEADAFALSRAQTQVQAASQSSSDLTPSQMVMEAASRHHAASRRMPAATLRDNILEANEAWAWQYEARLTMQRTVRLNHNPHDANWGAWQPQLRPEVVQATTLGNPQAAVEEVEEGEEEYSTPPPFSSTGRWFA